VGWFRSLETRHRSPAALRLTAVNELTVVNDLADDAFRRHYAEIYRFARRRTGDHYRAEELAQQVFADAAASLRADGRPPLAWLYAVARRRFADAARRSAREQGAFPAPAEDEYGLRLGNALRAALAQLTQSQREVVVLKLWRGASFAEIADLLATSEEAARMRFWRAMTTLRAALSEEGIDP
jgi:RNA polymerase sigma factor (sigma-70 family)